MGNQEGEVQDVDAVMLRAVEARVFPGAVLQVSLDGEPLLTRAYGTTMYEDPGSRAVAVDTIYDLASLTKAFTAGAALMLADQRELSLQRPIRHYLPEARAEVTVQQLLTHTSGLDRQLSRLRDLAASRLLAEVLATEPTCEPGSLLAYANINTLLLGLIVAAVAGMPLDAALRELIWQPLGMGETGFKPAEALRERIAPTEIDEEWRAAVVQGVVHDESAFALGGVAGHAGVFAPAADVTRYLQLWAQEGAYGGRQLLQPATVAAALRDYTAHLPARIGPSVATGLGWMLARPQFMGRAAAGGYGHTGFTGPVMLVLPQWRMTIVLLSNRTYPRRTPPPFAHHPITAAVVDALISAV